MSKATSEQPVRRRWVLGSNNRERILLPDNISTAPPRVAEANRKSLQAFASFAEAQAQFGAAKAGLKAAEGIDQARDVAAVAAGEQMPKPEERVTPAARAACMEAERRYDAELSNLRGCQYTLASEIADARDGWIDGQRECIAGLQYQLAALGETLGALGRERRVLDGLVSFPGGGSLVVTDLGSLSGAHEAHRARHRDAAVAQVRSAKKNRFQSSGTVLADVVSLMAALEVLVIED